MRTKMKSIGGSRQQQKKKKTVTLRFSAHFKTRPYQTSPINSWTFFSSALQYISWNCFDTASTRSVWNCKSPMLEKPFSHEMNPDSC